MPSSSPVARVLVIEDNPSDVMLIHESLREQGFVYELVHFADGEEAVRKLTEQPESLPSFDIVILDLNMPRVSGLEVLSSLKESPAFAKTPVVVLTSSLAPDEQREARRLGASEYLRKPSELQEFLNEVGSAVGRLIRRSNDDKQWLRD